MANHLYLHIPFCRCICAYCDFYRLKYNRQASDNWVYALSKEIDTRNFNKDLKTIYLGGGTPSALEIDQLEAVLQMLEPYAQNVKEYTIECNIESLDVEKVKIMKQYGINRMSIGVQSFNDALQNIMERVASKKTILDTIKMVYENGITNLSVDFIYGLPTQTLAMWEEDLNEIVLNPYISHISLYSLTIEKNSKFGKLGYKPAETELETAMYEKAIAVLEQHGFEHYEIASFAKNKCYSQHNLSYWTYQDFYGVSTGASGKEGNIRYDNVRDLLKYNKFIFQREETVLSNQDILFEHVMMNLRLRHGIDIEAYEARHNVVFMDLFGDVVERLIKKEWLVLENGILKTTYAGMFALHDVLVEFMD